MPEADKRSDQEKLLDDICPIHQTPMVKTQQHVGEGKVQWSEPACVLCDELKAAGKYVEALASIKADDEKRKAAKAAPASKPEQQQPPAVKTDAAPAAKT